jgi:hypothetical protein
MKIHYVIPISLCLIASPAMADECDFLIAQFQQRPIAIIDTSPTPANDSAAIANRDQAMKLFAEGSKQCNNGQLDQGVAKIQQAISLLPNK